MAHKKYSILILTFITGYLWGTVTPLIPREVLFGNPEKTGAQISPDGTRLSYLAPVHGVLNVWIKTLGTSDDKPVTHEKKRPIFTHFWSHNNQYILYLKDTNGDENYHLYRIDLKTNTVTDLTPFDGVKTELIALDKHFPNEVLIGLNKENPKLFDAYHLDLLTGALTLVAKNPGSMFYWLADTEFKVRAGIANTSVGTQILMVRDNEDDPWRSIWYVGFDDTLKDELYCGLLQFSSNGKSLYLNTSYQADTRRLIKLNLETKKYEVIAQNPDYDIASVIFNDDTYKPAIVCWNKKRLDYEVLDETLKSDFEHMRALSSGDLASIDYNDNAMTWVLGFLYDNKSYEYYLYDRTTGQSTFLFAWRPKLANYHLSTMQPISYVSRDGLKIEGYLTLPEDIQKSNLPMVLLVHGGPFSRDSWGYHSEVQFFANRGYAVLQVNFRGSKGYGKKFLAAGNLEWGGKMQDDLTDAVQWAVDQKIADPKKIAIYGASYGGYAALAGATFTPDLYCCCVDYVGVSNLITVLQTLPAYWNKAQWEQRIGSSSDEAFLKSRSPLFNCEKIKIPLLIAHGANDPRVKQSESEQIVQVLKDKNLPHEYLLFHDEGHGFARPENRLTFYTAVEKFLAQHLGGRFQEQDLPRHIDYKT